MNKYVLIISNTLQQYFVYRLNFILWRVRIVLSVLMGYFLWETIFATSETVFGYDQHHLLTYMLLVTIINGFVFASQTNRVAEEINFGQLSDILIRPINYFWYTFMRDIADKMIHTLFSFVEFTCLIFFLKPQIFFQTNVLMIIYFLMALLLGAVLYYEIGMILSFIGFWSHETWAPRFIFSIIVVFLAGLYFPLDIFPYPINIILQLLPFAFLGFFPLKVYIGMSSNWYIIMNFFILASWIVIFWIIMNILWIRGLKLYTSEGK